MIFITAYPDRLLTGERPEPAFLITKPYQPDTVKAIVSQALFFERRAHLRDRPAVVRLASAKSWKRLPGLGRATRYYPDPPMKSESWLSHARP